MDDTPVNLTDLTRALRLAAQRATSPEVAAEWIAAADRLDNAIRLTEERGDKNLRNVVQGALGMAELGLADHLRALSTEIKENTLVVNEMHQRLADTQNEQRVVWQKQEAADKALRAEFHDGMEKVGERVSDLEGRMDASEADRKAIRKELKNAKTERAQTQATVVRVETRLEDFITRIETLIEQNPVSEDERDKMLDFIRDQMRREAGNASSG